MQSGEVLSAGMFDIENNVFDLYSIYFGEVCIKDVGHIEIERVPKKCIIIRHGVGTQNPLDIFFFKCSSPM